MVALTGIFSDLLSAVPSQSAILDSVLAGVAGTVIISGAKSTEGQDALDPLHFFHHAPSGTSGVVQGPAANVITMSKFMALTPDQQKMFQAMNYTIVPG
jgi:hypothetical protein